MSRPDEPAEKEADATADSVASDLHEGEKQDEHAADEKSDGKKKTDKKSPDKKQEKRRDGAAPIQAKLDGVGLKVFRSGDGKPPDPRRAPIIKGDVATRSVTAVDPASEQQSLVGTCTWSGGFVTLVVYPKDSIVNGAKVTEETRMRGAVIFDAMIAKVKEILGELIAEYEAEFKSPGEQAQIQKTFQIKGVNGVWSGDSTNLIDFNKAFKAGKSLVDSAKSTFTYDQASKKLKFEKVTMTKTDPDVLTDPSKLESARATGFKSVHCKFEP